MNNSLLSMVRRMLIDEIQKSGLSQADFAKKVRIYRSTLQKILYSEDTETRKSLRSNVVDNILDSLGYTYSDLEEHYRINSRSKIN